LFRQGGNAADSGAKSREWAETYPKDFRNQGLNWGVLVRWPEAELRISGRLKAQRVSRSTAEAHNQHRDMLRRLGAARDTLWIAELTDSLAERNRRAIWDAINAPGEDAAISCDNLRLASRGFRMVGWMRRGQLDRVTT
jgi:hypothetical protein